MDFLRLSTRLLLAAIVVLVAGGVLLWNMDGSVQALSAIGGAFIGTAPNDTARIALFIDFLFPVFYGSGLIFFAVGLQPASDASASDARTICSLVCSVLIVAVGADFVENSLAMTALAGGGGMSEQPCFATLVKYGLIAMSGPLISVLIAARDSFSRFMIVVLRYLVPVTLAIPASHAFPKLAQLAPVAFVVFLALLAVFSNKMASQQAKWEQA